MRTREMEGSHRREETRQSGGSGERGNQTERKRERNGKEEDAWCGQDRRANGGHRTEMASGSAFQYSTLATLGHPTSSASHPALPFLFFSILGVFLFVSHAHTFVLCALSLSLFAVLSSGLSCAVLFLPFRSLSSLSAMVLIPLSDRSSASSFGLRVLLFRFSAFLSFRSLAAGSRRTFLLTATLRTDPFRGLYRTRLSASLSFSRIPRVLSWISRSFAYFSIKSGD